MRKMSNRLSLVEAYFRMSNLLECQGRAVHARRYALKVEGDRSATRLHVHICGDAIIQVLCGCEYGQVINHI